MKRVIKSNVNVGTPDDFIDALYDRLDDIKGTPDKVYDSEDIHSDGSYPDDDYHDAK